MSYDFSKLTGRQQELLTFGGWMPGSGMTQPGPRTVAKLLERGLLVEHEQRNTTGQFSFTVKTYSVPTPVHIAWCEYCAKDRS